MCLFALSHPCFGDSIAITPEPPYYLQTASSDQTLGWAFTVESNNVVVTKLGIFDAGSDGLENSHPISIWTDTGEVVLTTTIPNGRSGDLVGMFRYVDVPPTRLDRSEFYVIGSYYGIDMLDMWSDTDDKDTGPYVTYRVDRRGNGDSFPEQTGRGVDPGFFGPNFQFVIVPDPPCDFDSDGLCNASDIDLMFGVGDLSVGASVPPADPVFDLDMSDVIDISDVDQWLSAAAAQNGFSEPFLSGDGDLSGVVDATDLNALALNWRQNIALWSGGDFTADGVVDSVDLNALALNWRQSIRMTSVSAPVPEPSASLLAVIGLALAWRRSTPKVGIGQLSTAQVGRDQVGEAQVGTAQVGTGQGGIH